MNSNAKRSAAALLLGLLTTELLFAQTPAHQGTLAWMWVQGTSLGVNGPVTDFSVRRGPRGGPYAQVADVPAGVQTYVDQYDPAVTPEGTTVCYVIVARNAPAGQPAAASGPSPEVCGVVPTSAPPPPLAPAPPFGVSLNMK